MLKDHFGMVNVNSKSTHCRSLEIIFKEQMENTANCGKVLEQLFASIEEPDAYIAKIKSIEEHGDKLTAEAYRALEAIISIEIMHITELLIQRLDDIVDGINNTARMIDIFRPKKIEEAAHELVTTLMGMIFTLQDEVKNYPDINVESARLCRESLKVKEEEADLIYHNWRKKQYRVLVLPLVDESNWTEILGILEQTTDATYHAAVIFEREARFRHKSVGDIQC